MMPVYEYQCVENGHRFELYQPVGTDPPACPVCGSASRKVYSSVGLIFKGSGFHVTDYPRPGGSVEKTDDKGDAKPAPAPDGSSTGTATSGDAAGGTTPKKASDAGSPTKASDTGSPKKASDA
ncbi:MAG TPA: zinc ribbon domain-containing protein [bacterium]|jgi:putative FmdB family regulatory protein|nr:zinc ribbon domain-containing protein [bacterium]